MATRPSYFRERARNPYLKARPPAPGLEQEPNASPLAPADFLATPPRRAVAPQSTPTFDPNQAVMATMPALLPEGAVARAAPPDVGSLAFLPPPDEAAGAGASAPRNVTGGATPPVVDPLDAPRAAFMAGTPTTTKGRILQALANAGLGALQAAGRDRENPLGAALGGAIAGGGISAVNPRYGRAYQFEQFKRPEIEAREAREQELLRRRRAEEDRALNEEYRRAQIGELGRRNLPRQLPPPRPVSTPRGALDPTTNTIIPGTEPLPRERAPHYEKDVDGRVYDMNNPEDRKRWDALPRGKRVKPEKVAGGESGKNVVEVIDATGQVLGRMPYHQVKFDKFGDVQGFPEGSRVRFPQAQGRQQMGPRLSATVNPEFSLTEGLGAPVQPRAGGKTATMRDVRNKAKQLGVSVEKARAGFEQAGYKIR